ncbi:MAG: AraC family transcriptional regulator [bacterium]|nr:AraC family transcriptional regulator [bacterium]
MAGQIGLGNNVQYFYQVFKRYTGKTPREYQLEAGETIERRLF